MNTVAASSTLFLLHLDDGVGIVPVAGALRDQGPALLVPTVGWHRVRRGRPDLAAAWAEKREVGGAGLTGVLWPQRPFGRQAFCLPLRFPEGVL